MRRRLARWTVGFPMEGGLFVFYAALTGSVVLLDRRRAQALLGGECLDEETETELAAGGIVVDETVDEDRHLSELFDSLFRQTEVLDLTVAATFRCNFSCPYCYEKRSDRDMSPRTQEALLDWLDALLQETNYRRLTLNLYGGEPLLVPEIFVALYRGIADRTSIPLSIRLVTNGSLLDTAFARLGSEMAVDRVQVTLHGSRELHDGTRRYHDGRPSFDDILSSVRRISQQVGAVEIRVNVDNASIATLDDLFSQLLGDYAIHSLDNVSVFFYPVVPFTDQSKCWQNQCMGKQPFRKKLPELVRKAVDSGLVSKRMGAARYVKSYMEPGLCGVHTGSFYIVDPDGFIYTCWELVGDRRYEIGNVLAGGIEETKHVVWRAAGKKKWQECLPCNLFAVCGGGCVAEAIATKGGAIDGSACMFSDDRSELNQLLKLYVELRRKETSCFL